MTTMVILGAGQFGRAAVSLLNTSFQRLIAFGDNSPQLQGTRISSPLADIPVLSVEEAVSLNPDTILIGVTDEERSSQLKKQALTAGFHGSFLMLGELYRFFDIRSATLHRIADRVRSQQLPGDVAELGVYRGDFAWQLNACFPDRRLYLFDTFEGFDGRDTQKEAASDFSRAQTGDFHDTSIEMVQARLPFPHQAVFKKGYFPETAAGMEDCRFCLVSLDADLYAPLLAGLTYFYPRLSPGGMIILHDYHNRRFRGAGQAVSDYEKAHGPLLLVPLCDLHGTAVILHP